jgi:hypothetical protein
VQLTLLASAPERTSMSFSRHEEIYRSDVKLGKPGSGHCCRRSQRSSAAMSFQSAIPWKVALRQSLPPLHRLQTILNNPRCRTMTFQQTATAPLTSCLSPRVHSSRVPHPFRVLCERMGRMTKGGGEPILTRFLTLSPVISTCSPPAPWSLRPSKSHPAMDA